jgi:hypothetical protein
MRNKYEEQDLENSSSKSILRTISSQFSPTMGTSWQKDNYFSFDDNFHKQEEPKNLGGPLAVIEARKCDCPSWAKLVAGIGSVMIVFVFLILICLFIERDN